jgi:hypothetical protein
MSRLLAAALPADPPEQPPDHLRQLPAESESGPPEGYDEINLWTAKGCDKLTLEADLFEIECRLFAADRLIADGCKDCRNAAALLVGDALAVVRKLRNGLFPDFPAGEKPNGDEP